MYFKINILKRYRAHPLLISEPPMKQINCSFTVSRKKFNPSDPQHHVFVIFIFGTSHRSTCVIHSFRSSLVLMFSRSFFLFSEERRPQVLSVDAHRRAMPPFAPLYLRRYAYENSLESRAGPCPPAGKLSGRALCTWTCNLNEKKQYFLFSRFPQDNFLFLSF